MMEELMQQQQQQQQQPQQQNEMNFGKGDQSVESIAVVPDLNDFQCPISPCTFFSQVDGDLLAHFRATHFNYPKVVVFDPAERVNHLLYRCLRKNCSELMPTVEDFFIHLIVHKQKEIDLANYEQAKNLKVESAKAKEKMPAETTLPTSLLEEKKEKVSFMEQSKQVENSTPSTNQKPNKKKKYRCLKCYQLFLKQADLEEHTTTDNHHHQCTLCEEKVFASNARLKRHLSVSHGVTFKCDYCEKTYKTANYVKVHMMVHSDKNPFICKICKAAFNLEKKLKKHSLLHNPVKKYKCDKCHWDFSRLDKLKEHIMTHSGAKPYQCVHCPRSFIRFGSLKKHVKSHKTIQENKLAAVAAAAAVPSATFATSSGHNDESILQQSLLPQQSILLQYLLQNQQQQAETESNGNKDKVGQQQQVLGRLDI